MGRGVGKTQQTILDQLVGEQEFLALTVTELAQRVGASDRQIRTAVRALERRGLVVITKEHIGWSGRGEYGPLVELGLAETEGLPTAKVVDTGRHWFDDAEGRYRAIKRELGHIGMPRAGLLVWLPQQRSAWLKTRIESIAGLAKALGGLSPTGQEKLAAMMAEAQRLGLGDL